MTIYQGLDLNGIRDVLAELPKSHPGTPQLKPSPTPPCVVLHADPRRPPLAGQHAEDSITGRGWPQSTPAASASNYEDSARIPILKVLRRVQKGEQEIETKCGRKKPGRLLKAHLSNQLKRAARNHSVIAIEDDSSETCQDAILNTAVAAGRRSRLLWRPVAALLGWGATLSEPELNELSDKLAVVIHLGYRSAEVSVLSLHTKTHNEKLYLVPQRHHTGETVQGWRGRKFWQELADSEVDRISPESTDNHESLAWQLKFGTSRIADLILGEPPEESLIQHSDGTWLLAPVTQGRPGNFPENGQEVNDCRDSIELALQAQFNRAAFDGRDIGCILVEGEMSRLPLQTLSLGKKVANQVKTWIENEVNRVPVVRVLDNQSGTVAIGCAHHAYRLDNEIESYYDFLPQIEINALTESGVEFTALVEKQDKWPGGKQYGPRRVRSRKARYPFLAPIGARDLEFYLYKEGERCTRKSITQIPSPPLRDVPATLEVTQEPGQGHARVKIVTNPPRVLGHKAIELDWSKMEPTDKTREEMIEEFKKDKARYEYPAIKEITFHPHAWEDKYLEYKLTQFIDASSPEEKRGRSLYIPNDYEDAIDALFPLKRGLRDPDQSPIGADGNVPENYKDLFEEFLQRADEELDRLHDCFLYGRPDRLVRKLYNRLFILLSWCYARAPETHRSICLALTRGTERSPHPSGSHSIGRSLHQPEDLKLLFAEAARQFPEYIGAPTKWIKPLAEVLTFREEAWKSLQVKQADIIAFCLKRVLEYETRRANYKQKFYQTVLLLIALLRFRQSERDFLGKADPRVDEIRNLLKDAKDRIGYPARKATIQEAIDFLEGKGKNMLILGDLLDLAETD